MPLTLLMQSWSFVTSVELGTESGSPKRMGEGRNSVWIRLWGSLAAKGREKAGIS